jgi:hypothetical protein
MQWNIGPYAEILICVYVEIHRCLVHRYTSVSNLSHGGEVVWTY